MARDVLLLFGTHNHQTANTITDSELNWLTFGRRKAKINFKNWSSV